MTILTTGQLDEDRGSALALMERALELLDACGSGNDVGAHLDLAICRLRERLRLTPTDLLNGDLSAYDRLDADALPWPKAS